MKVAPNEKGKKLHRFSFSINIANFEAFLLVFKLTKNLLFLKSVLLNDFSKEVIIFLNYLLADNGIGSFEQLQIYF